MTDEERQAIIDEFIASVKQPEKPTGDVPEGMFLNPHTGQMTSREMLRNNVAPSKGQAFGFGAAQGATFQYGDELIGALRGMIDGKDAGKFATESLRAQMEANQEAHPWAFGGGQVVGALPAGVAATPYATGATMGGTMGRGATIGAIEGFLHGTGRGEGAGDRLATGAQDSLIGAGVGGAAPPIVAAGKHAVTAVLDPFAGAFDAATNTARQSRANRALMSTLKRSGRSADDIADDVARAAREGQPEYRLMDAMGKAGQRRASGVVRAGGEGAEELAEYLERRQLGQGERVASFVEDAFDVNGTTAAKTRAALTTARDDAADIAYDAARGNAAPVDVRGALSVIDDRIGGMESATIKGDSIDGRLAGFRARLAGTLSENGENLAAELSDFNRVLGVKQDVSDAIGAAVRAGRKNEARELTKLRNALDAALEGASDMYRTANDDFARASGVIGAVDEGAALARPGARAADTIDTFRAMTPDQQAAARVGYGDRALTRLEAQTSPTADRSKMFTSPKVERETRAIAQDPRLFRDRISRESDMWQTQNRALGGSRTADNLEDIGDLSATTRIAQSIRHGGVADTALNLLGAVAPYAKGQNEATREIIARALMSSDPQKALAPVLRQASSTQSKQRLVDALMRAITTRSIASNN